MRKTNEILNENYLQENYWRENSFKERNILIIFKELKKFIYNLLYNELYINYHNLCCISSPVMLFTLFTPSANYIVIVFRCSRSLCSAFRKTVTK